MKKRAVLISALFFPILLIWLLGVVPAIQGLVMPRDPSDVHIITFYYESDHARYYVYIDDRAPSAPQLEALVRNAPVATSWKYEVVMRWPNAGPYHPVYTVTGDDLSYLCAPSLKRLSYLVEHHVTRACPGADKLLERKRREDNARCLHNYRYCDDLMLRMPN